MLSLIETILGAYVLFAGVYLGACLAVSALNRTVPGAKIQTRQATPEQIRRDRRQSLVSLAVIAVMFGAGQWTHTVLHWGFPAPRLSVASVVITFVVSMVVFDTWFYWLHRLIHTRWFYRRVHQWHHMTSAPVVWSNNSDRAVDNLFLQSYWFFAHLILPIAPVVLIAHKLYDQVTGVIGHSGYEHGGRICWPPSPMLGVTHHDQHHQFFRCNYATHFTFWDRAMGTLHPDYDATVRRNIQAAGQGARPPSELPAE